nr:MAG TPA: hypothetical protein [Caudoviricetes sp.]
MYSEYIRQIKNSTYPTLNPATFSCGHVFTLFSCFMKPKNNRMLLYLFYISVTNQNSFTYNAP